MRRYGPVVVLLVGIGILLDFTRPRSVLAGIIQAIIPAAVPTANKQGNGSLFQLSTGATVNGHCVQYDANGNAIDSGAACAGTGTPGATLFSSTTQAGPNDTAAETSLIGTVTGSTTIAANTFTDGAILEVRGQGFFSLPATADSLTVKAKCGSTVLASAVFTPAAGVVTNGTFRLWLMITAIGSGGGGAFMTNGGLDLYTTGPTVFENAKLLNTSNVAFDFTTSCAFNLTAQWGAAQVGELMTGTNVAAWIPGAPVTSVNGLTGAVTANQQITIANEGTTGTTVNKLAKLTGAPSTAIITANSDTAGAVGVVISGAGTAGSATIQIAGSVSCVFEGATTAGNYVILGSVTAGDCKDGGATYPTSGQVIGRVLSTNGGAGTYSIDLFPSEIKGFSGGGGGASITQGTYASLPGTCTTNDLYFFTDSVYTGRCSASNTWSLFYQGAMLATVPPTAGWTGDNTSAGAGTQSSTQGYLYSTFTNAGATNARFFFRTAPATPWSATALIKFDLVAAGATGNEVGLLFGFRDGTGKLVVWMLQKSAGVAKAGDAKWTSTASFSAYYVAANGSASNSVLLGPNPVWLQIRDCGAASTGSCTGLASKIQFSYSFDGQNFIQFDAETRTDFLGSGPTEYGYGAYVGDGAVNTFLYSLLEGT